jgi:uncharacterized protein Yka (UPF0111/DUF47 family)
MDNHFKYIGGCYIPHLRTILIRDNPNILSSKEQTNKFDQLISKYRASVDVDDVLVHELLHAVSAKMGRASRRFEHMEEEFVYTNCIDFYKQKGMTEDDIVNKNFLPFCMQDVFSVSREFKKVLSCIGDTSKFYNGTTNEVESFLSDNAEQLVKEIVKRAKELGQQMINLYNGNRNKVEMVDNTELRFSNLDF